MTDKETLAEIERQEKRFADAGFGRGLRLAHSAREYYAEMMEMRRRAFRLTPNVSGADPLF